MTESETRRWNYVGKCEPERRTALSKWIQFSNITDRLIQEMKLVCYHREPRVHDASYARTVHCVKITSATFDAFFNSQAGYRGAYFVSREAGLRANQSLFELLTPTLMSWTKQHYHQVDQDWMAKSLSTISAKAWLTEAPFAESHVKCKLCADEWSCSYFSELQIENGRWERCENVYSRWGRQAPQLTKLRFFGGFVNGSHHEWVPPHKRERATDIWKHGWT